MRLKGEARPLRLETRRWQEKPFQQAFCGLC
jgi:hypothetical protein